VVNAAEASDGVGHFGTAMRGAVVTGHAGGCTHGLWEWRGQWTAYYAPARFWPRRNITADSARTTTDAPATAARSDSVGWLPRSTNCREHGEGMGHHQRGRAVWRTGRLWSLVPLKSGRPSCVAWRAASRDGGPWMPMGNWFRDLCAESGCPRHDSTHVSVKAPMQQHTATARRRADRTRSVGRSAWRKAGGTDGCGSAPRSGKPALI